MLFDRKKHTKDYLLQNPDVACQLAVTSPLYQNGIAQDEDYLVQAYTSVEEVVKNPVEKLCNQEKWITSGAAQNKKVLAAASRTRLTVAHCLSKHEAWSGTAAAQDVDTLMLTRQNGYSVGHSLASRQTWGVSPASQDLAIIDNLRSRHVGLAVVHYLAKSNKAWWGTPVAHRKNVLMIKTTRDQETVAELAFYRISDAENRDKTKQRDQADAIARLVKLGQALLFKRSPLLSDDAISILVEMVQQELESHTDDNCKAHIIAALYSTLVHVRSFDYVQAECPALPGHIYSLEKQLLEMVENHPALRKSLMATIEDGCDSARNIVCKMEAKKAFESISEFSNDANESQIPTNY